MLPISALDYELDPGAVATRPAEPRDAARMLVLHRREDRVEHRLVRDLPEYLREGDRLVLNRTRVMTARLVLRRIGDERLTDGLLEIPLEGRRWQMRLRHTRRFRPGDRLELIAPNKVPSPPTPTGGGVDHARPLRSVEGALNLDPPPAVLRVLGRREEGVVVEFEGEEPVESLIDRCGWVPLPPYILRARAGAGRPLHTLGSGTEGFDREHYQTIFAQRDDHPSIAAPTAGLHFTPELLAAVRAKGVRRLEVVLQVGAGTFQPVETEFLEQHPMHAEWYRVPADSLAELARAEALRAAGTARVVAVGTTSVRVLESLADPLPPGDADLSDLTRLLILPTSPVRRVDALMTNFHLPRSTLLALVGAFVGLERLKALYAMAQREGYRFYSYGDSMLIL